MEIFIWFTSIISGIPDPYKELLLKNGLAFGLAWVLISNRLTKPLQKMVDDTVNKSVKDFNTEISGHLKSIEKKFDDLTSTVKDLAIEVKILGRRMDHIENQNSTDLENNEREL